MGTFYGGEQLSSVNEYIAIASSSPGDLYTVPSGFYAIVKIKLCAANTLRIKYNGSVIARIVGDILTPNHEVGVSDSIISMSSGDVIDCISTSKSYAFDVYVYKKP